MHLSAQHSSHAGRQKKAGARRPRLSSWLCARIKAGLRCQVSGVGGSSKLFLRPDTCRSMHFAVAALSSLALVPEYSTSASRSVARDTATPRPRIDLPSTHALPPAGSVPHPRADPARLLQAPSPIVPAKIRSALLSRFRFLRRRFEERTCAAQAAAGSSHCVSAATGLNTPA